MILSIRECKLPINTADRVALSHTTQDRTVEYMIDPILAFGRQHHIPHRVCTIYLQESDKYRLVLIFQIKHLRS